MASTETIELTDELVGRLEIGDRSVRRLGFGAMRITGEGIWGPPADRDGGDRGSCAARSSWAST